jgi:hypothetical protein
MLVGKHVLRPLAHRSLASLSPAQRDNVFTSRKAQFQALLKEPDCRLLPEAARLVLVPDVLATFIGGSEKVEIDLPEGMSTADRRYASEIFLTLIRRMNVLTGQALELDNFSAPDRRWVLKNRSAAMDIQGIGAELSSTPEARFEKHEQLRPQKVLPTSVRVVSMISFCSSPQQIAALNNNLNIWDRNLRHFRHEGAVDAQRPPAPIAFRVSDDSPEPYATQVRQVVEGMNALATPVARFTYVGKAEREAERLALVQRVLASRTARKLIAAHRLSRADVHDMSRRMFGGLQSGVAQNRNMALLLAQRVADTLPEGAGRGRVFQVDHDQTPEALMMSRYEDPWRRRGHRPVALPVDLLGYFEGAHDLESAAFSGGTDADIESLVMEMPALTAEGFFGQPPGLEARYAKDPWDPLVTVVYKNDEVDDVLRAPMFVPPGVVPWSTPERDQDIHMGEVHGNAASGAPTYVYHRDLAGSKWASPAKLMRDSLLSNVSLYVLRKWLPAGGTSTPDTLRRAGELILESLPFRPAADEAMRLWAADSQQLARKWFSSAADSRARLDAMRDGISRVEPPAFHDSLGRWVFGREPGRLSGAMRAHLATPEAKAKALEQIAQAIERLNAAAEEMRSTFFTHLPDGVDRLAAEITARASESVRSVAVSFLFNAEIRDPAPAAPARTGRQRRPARR